MADSPFALPGSGVKARVTPLGVTLVATEGADSVSVRALLSNQIMLPNGQRAQVKRVWTDTPIAQSQTDAAFIPAPPTGYYIVIVALKVICDAATLVTLNSKGAGAGTGIDAPWPNAANGGFVEPMTGAVLAKGNPAEAITLTTGAGGNTYARALFVEVPINVDIL